METMRQIPLLAIRDDPVLPFLPCSTFRLGASAESWCLGVEKPCRRRVRASKRGKARADHWLIHSRPTLINHLAVR